MDPSLHSRQGPADSTMLTSGAYDSTDERHLKPPESRTSHLTVPPERTPDGSDFSSAGRGPSRYRSTVGRLSRFSFSGSGESNSSRSPLHMNLGFLKNLTERKTTREGQTPKRRGPKPDSKPALTRRQELNRQAQRTHRERKEMYIKALEQEVLRLKDNVSNALREKDSHAEENGVLKQLLLQNGITLPVSVANQFGVARTASSGDFGGSSSGSMPGSFTGGSNGNAPPQGIQGNAVADPRPGFATVHPPNGKAHPGVDYDQTGIDFILTLEHPCRDHMPYLLARAQAPEGEICGHAFMVSCPPESHAVQHPEVPYTPGSGEMRQHLGTLMDMSKRLDLDGEVTPVMAWGLIIDHPRVQEINPRDFQGLKDDLKAKIRCYGFGAVLEDFEVRDALESIFATKIESYASFT